MFVIIFVLFSVSNVIFIDLQNRHVRSHDEIFKAVYSCLIKTKTSSPTVQPQAIHQQLQRQPSFQIFFTNLVCTIYSERQKYGINSLKFK
jgi:hypothetical protein